MANFDPADLLNLQAHLLKNGGPRIAPLAEMENLRELFNANYERDLIAQGERITRFHRLLDRVSGRDTTPLSPEEREALTLFGIAPPA